MWFGSTSTDCVIHNNVLLLVEPSCILLETNDRGRTKQKEGIRKQREKDGRRKQGGKEEEKEG